MKISVRVKTNARKNEIQKIDENNYLVSVSVPPIEGKANERVIELLSRYFKKPKRSIVILKGETSKSKIIEIL